MHGLGNCCNQGDSTSSRCLFAGRWDFECYRDFASTIPLSRLPRYDCKSLQIDKAAATEHVSWPLWLSPRCEAAWRVSGGPPPRCQLKSPALSQRTREGQGTRFYPWRKRGPAPSRGQQYGKFEGTGVHRVGLEVERTNLANQVRHVDAALSVLGKLNGGRFATKPRRT